jgi:hypothetical protein
LQELVPNALVVVLPHLAQMYRLSLLAPEGSVLVVTTNVPGARTVLFLVVDESDGFILSAHFHCSDYFHVAVSVLNCLLTLLGPFIV